jgi:hypothetical protein
MTKKKEVPASTITFNCDDSCEDVFQVQEILRISKIKIGDTGSSLVPPYGRDIQVPTSQVKIAKQIIESAGCKIISIRKDIPMP